jgi:hypothetical protein
MATSNRGGNRGRGRNNNPEGRNQYSSWTDTARDRPFAAAATAAAAVGAGVFLWSRRNQISDQISSLADQISEWREGMSSSGDDLGSQGSGTEESFMAQPSRRGGRKTQTQLAEEALTLKETGKTA